MTTHDEYQSVVKLHTTKNGTQPQMLKHLKQEGELGVAVRHVRGLLVAQRIDDFAQRRERLVDVLRLLQAVASGIRLAHAL